MNRLLNNTIPQFILDKFKYTSKEKRVRTLRAPEYYSYIPEAHHTVQAGDNLYYIARLHNVDLGHLLDMNSDLRRNPDLIYPGQVIRLV
jgi:LysM repeat protein